LVLGGHVEDALQNAVAVIARRDTVQSKHLIANNRNISRKCANIEANALTLLATQQPMAGDLRTITTTLEIALELACIADHAREIAEINLKLNGSKLPRSFADIDFMARIARQMLHASLKAFVDQDEESARLISQRDDDVDRLYQQIHRGLLKTITAEQTTIAQAIYFLGRSTLNRGVRLGLKPPG